jgi:hypothetical protein
MKVCISHLGKEQDQQVRRMLLELGAIPTAFHSGADAVIMRDTAINDAAAAHRDGFAVITVSEFSRMARGAEVERAAFEVDGDSVRILDVTLGLEKDSGPFVPEPERFRHLCFDRLFLTTARKAALSVAQGIPCMLEGDTATAKTSSILWLAMLCGHDVIRINLNGHTDTGELVGRYVPATSGRGKAWTFREGYIPQALRKGWWVILDEVNLAEPQVLERLNPVLEDPATLVLTEHDGTRFGSGADVEVAEGFHLFGTMNPAEYAGRSPLSPAFRDRWGIWSHVPKPSEPELLDMLRCLVTGISPSFVWDGVRWTPPAGTPIYPALSDYPDWEGTLAAIASFHARISGAAGESEAPATIGRVRRERYVFTRRTLLNAMRLIAATCTGALNLRGVAARVLGEIYIHRLQESADRSAALTLLRATGLA